MSRIPASASITLAGLLPVCAAALGLGEVESKSYLNQPFSAEIPVFTEVASEIAGLDVSLASANTFSQYGLQRPAFLGDLKFAVVPGPRGAVIRITSPQPVMEPFVTLLLEVRWPQGRLLREYTVLLDPPAFAGGATRQPVQAPTAAATPVVSQPEPSATASPPAPPAAAPTPARSAPLEAGGTHTVARNETLWGIAERYRPDTADMNQVMLAIYRANPDAFAGNINRLNAGAVLRIPDRGSIDGLARSEARAEVKRQYSEWRGAAAAADTGARLELVPPSEGVRAEPPGAPSPAASTPSAKLAAEVEESRRLVAVKDAELQALRQRVAELEKQGSGDVAVEAEPPPTTATTPPPAVEAPVAAAPPAAEPAPAPEKSAAPAKPVRAPSPAGDQPGILGTITGLLTSIWFWAAAAVVLVGALLLARRRSAVEETPWRPTTRRGGDDEDTEAPSHRDEDMIVIEEPGRAQATGGFDRRSAPRGDEELPLERTISTDGPVNLDQSDPLAEADFHMAYGLYDQAADLLTAAAAREPGRRDLQLKLLDVYFVWENREGFVDAARNLRERIGNEADPDWKRVIIMGKQLCPTEGMFAGAAAPAADEMDLAFSADSGGTTDLPGAGGLDFDLSGEEGFDPVEATRSTRSLTAQTQEIPTVEAPGVGSASTMETPTIENPGLSSTMETPTIETPTVETWSPDAGSTARLRGTGDERSDQTEEIDLEDLGLDLTGLDEAARDMATGLQEALPDAGGDLDFDLSGAESSGVEEPTEEMEKNSTLNNLAKAMGRGDSTGGPRLAEDTAEQPGVADAGSALSSTSDDLESLNIDLDLSEEASDLTATGLRAIRDRRPEDPTMTEVGTKLDLARAYVDMGDPDGARSILNEVLEEGDPEQRQEARQLLDGLNG